ncbi:MAG: DUF1289 domain-containing protein [Candidatus Pacebacteria bacterium]|nr:DUF1289 domain-containing protein [Candidatus Paceibacterota bacterium]
MSPTADDIKNHRQRLDSEIPSPCVGICQMDEASGLCTGCYRTAAEIKNWRPSDTGARLAVYEKIQARRTQVEFKP